MNKPTYEDAITFLEAKDIKLYNYQKEMLKLLWDNKDIDEFPLFDEIIKPFQTKTHHKPLENQLIYVSSADMYNNPFIKMVREYLKTIKEKTNEE